MTSEEWTALRERILAGNPGLREGGQTAKPIAQRRLSEEELERELVESGFLGSVPPRESTPPPWTFKAVNI